MKTRMSGTAFGIIFVGLWTLIVGLFDSIIGYGVVGQFQAKSWPVTRGTITRSEITTSTDNDGTTYHPEIEFTFTVDGVAYTGDKHRFTAMGTSDFSYTQSVVNQYPVGGEVDVHYDADDPSRAVLETGVSSSDLVLMLFLTPFNVVMIGGWMLLLGGLRFRLTNPPAGGASIRRRGMRTHVRLPRLSPVTGALIAALAVSFIGVFVVVIGFGFDPPMSVILATWGLTLGLAVTVYFWRMFIIGSGRKDLVIDDEHGYLSLPQTFDRNEDVLVPAVAVTDVDVERIAHSSDNGTSYTWAPRLIWRDDEGATRREKLADWHNEDRARGLAAWLREHLRVGTGSRTTRPEPLDHPLLDL